MPVEEQLHQSTEIGDQIPPRLRFIAEQLLDLESSRLGLPRAGGCPLPRLDHIVAITVQVLSALVGTSRMDLAAAVLEERADAARVAAEDGARVHRPDSRRQQVDVLVLSRAAPVVHAEPRPE